MPTTYTHDLFGKEVYKRLSNPVKELLKRNQDLYRIGLHGPDLLFYYKCLYKNRVNQYGVEMHQTPALMFFEDCVYKIRDLENEELLAYVIGFCNHFALDTLTHPVVNRIVEEDGPSHTVLEKELDRYLMKENGLNPYKYHPSDAVKPKKQYVDVIHMAIPEVGKDEIWTSMTMMKMVTNMMVYDDEGKRLKVIMPVLTLAGLKETIGDHFMKKEAPEGISVYLKELLLCYENALKVSAQLIEQIYYLAKSNTAVHLSELFNRTYNG